MVAVACRLLRQRRFDQLEALGDAPLAVREAEPAFDQPLGCDQLRQPLVRVARGARQVIGLELKRLVEAPGELVVGALQQKRAVGEPGREASPEGLRPPGRNRSAFDRPVPPQPIEHHRAATLRRVAAAGRAQIAQPGKAVELGEPVFAGALVPPGRVPALAGLSRANDLAAEVVEARGQRLATPGNARYEIERPVPQWRRLTLCLSPGQATAEPPQGTEKALRGLLVPRAHGIG